MVRTLAPVDLRVISRVFQEIYSAPWFDPDDARALALFLIHKYSRDYNEDSLSAIAQPFAREWFKVGQPRFDVLALWNMRGE